MKNGIISLGGLFLFCVSGSFLHTGFSLPTQPIPQKIEPDILHAARNKDLVLYFKDNQLAQIAIELGLHQFLATSQEHLQSVLSQKLPEETELVTDTEWDFPEGITVRLVTKKERLIGLAQKWNLAKES